MNEEIYQKKKRILSEIEEMQKEMKARIDPNPQPERDLFFGKGYITACEVIKEIIDKELQ